VREAATVDSKEEEQLRKGKEKKEKGLGPKAQKIR
jgi:hypothetical protein